ncbi:MAG: glutamyl-tRNA reductase [Gammaproteobacteria bacterium]|nr:glutamyl-tRNA reductase [Gammaproteobacteria bacterium]
MTLLAFGINHKTAPVDIREKVAFSPEKVTEALRDLVSRQPVTEAVILSTCNRTEVYCGLDYPANDTVMEWFSHYHHLSPEAFSPYLYAHQDGAAVQHILRVASGLDSLVLGEPQILGQIKEAYTTAYSTGVIGSQLNRLFQHTFAVAKQVRTDTAIGASPVSVAFAAVSLAKQIFTDLSEHTVLLIGAGETIDLVARHLVESKAKKLIVANRTIERASELARKFNATAIALGDIPERLVEADIIISSTASPLPILGKGAVESALKQRKHRPLFMVDLAVPRDIEPEVAQLRDVYLYSVDDLHEVIEANRKSRQAAALQAEEIIASQVEHFMGWLRSLDAVDAIRAYRERSEQLRDETLAQAQRLLAAGKDPQFVIADLARTLTNKLIHAPSVHMKHAAYQGEQELLQHAAQILGLDDKSH